MKEPRTPLIPAYARLPLLLALACNLLVFYSTKWITAGWTHHSMALPLDGRIPFWPPAAGIYVLAFVQWVVGYCAAGRESRAACYGMVAADLAAKLLCLVCFLLAPTYIVRPAVTGGGFWNFTLRVIYWFDSPDNCFPSIHCLESWMCCRAALRSRTLPRWYRAGTTVLAVLVCASTVLIRQHVLVDVPAGILAAELGLLAARKWRLDRIFYRLEAARTKRSQHGSGGN